MIKSEEFKQWLVTLLAEIFGVSDSPHGYILDNGKSGLLGTINAMDAQTASAALKPGRETVASHCGHILFILRLHDAYETGQTPSHDWQGSWVTKVVDEAAWNTLRADLQAAYETAIGHIQAREDWSESPLSGAMVTVTHYAYHLGEIKQLLTSLT